MLMLAYAPPWTYLGRPVHARLARWRACPLFVRDRCLFVDEELSHVHDNLAAACQASIIGGNSAYGGAGLLMLGAALRKTSHWRPVTANIHAHPKTHYRQVRREKQYEQAGGSSAGRQCTPCASVLLGSTRIRNENSISKYWEVPKRKPSLIAPHQTCRAGTKNTQRHRL